MDILIVKTSSLGDILQTLPLLDYLHSRFPQARCDWVVEGEFYDLVAAHPQVHRAIPFYSRRWRRLQPAYSSSLRREIGEFFRQLRAVPYDLLFDLQGNGKSACVTGSARALLKVGFGWKSVPEKINLLATHKKIEIPSRLQVTARYLSLLQTHFQDATPFSPRKMPLLLSQQEREQEKTWKFPSMPRYMVAFGSKWRNKRLPPATLLRLLESIEERDHPHFYFIWSHEQEREVAERLSSHFPRSSSMGHLSLPLWQALMRKMDLVIAMDSAALHLCGTTETPSFSIFGPSLATVYKPLGPHHHIQGACPYGQTFERRCPFLRSCKTGACIHDLTAGEIFSLFPQRVRSPAHSECDS